MSQLLLPLGLVALGYLLGSIPFGLLLTRAAGLGDVRAIGSGNIGATNVLRTGRKGLAAATLLLDALKGTAAVLLAPLLAASAASGGLVSADILAPTTRALSSAGAAWFAGLGAVLGHLFPVWLGFKGGKGIATWIGVLLGAHWPAAALFAVVWLAVAAVTRFSSLAALVAVAGVLVYFAATAPWPVTALVALVSALLYWKHAANITRLLAGTESRIGAKG
jgi:glycerol-3-phosphate acyltransferase PlsY